MLLAEARSSGIAGLLQQVGGAAPRSDLDDRGAELSISIVHFTRIECTRHSCCTFMRILHLHRNVHFKRIFAHCLNCIEVHF